MQYLPIPAEYRFQLFNGHPCLILLLMQHTLSIGDISGLQTGQ